MDLQMRAAAQNSAVQWANDLMRQGVSAAMIEDAVNALLVKLKEQILIDTLTQQLNEEQERIAAVNNIPEAPKEEGVDEGHGE